MNLQRSYINALSTARRYGLAIATLSLSTSVWGQQITFADLEGAVIESDIVQQQLNQRGERQWPTQSHVKWRIVIRAEGWIDSTLNFTIQTPLGERKPQPLSGSFILDQSHKVGSSGGGQAVWHFEEGTLTWIRTFKQGAVRTKFAFSQNADGLSCQVSGSLAHENGVGGIEMESLIDGKTVTIISAKQISSSCRVFKGT